MGQVFGTAMSERSKVRQKLADLPIPLTANLTVVARKSGEGLIATEARTSKAFSVSHVPIRNARNPAVDLK